MKNLLTISLATVLALGCACVLFSSTAVAQDETGSDALYNSWIGVGNALSGDASAQPSGADGLFQSWVGVGDVLGGSTPWHDPATDEQKLLPIPEGPSLAMPVWNCPSLGSQLIPTWNPPALDCVQMAPGR